MWYSIQSSDLINWSGSGEQILTVIWNNCLYVFKVVLPIVVPTFMPPIIFFLWLYVALVWKNFVLLSLLVSQSIRDRCFHIRASLSKRILISCWSSLTRILISLLTTSISACFPNPLKKNQPIHDLTLLIRGRKKKPSKWRDENSTA